MDVCDLIESSHDDLLQRANAMADAPCPLAAKDAYRGLRDALNRHARAAEAVVYDSLKQLGDDATALLGLRGPIELAVGEELLAQMARGNAESRAWRAKADVVRTLLQRHVADAQRQLTPLLRRDFSAEQRDALGRRFDKRSTALMAA